MINLDIVKYKMEVNEASKIEKRLVKNENDDNIDIDDVHPPNISKKRKNKELEKTDSEIVNIQSIKEDLMLQVNCFIDGLRNDMDVVKERLSKTFGEISDDLTRIISESKSDILIYGNDLHDQINKL